MNVYVKIFNNDLVKIFDTNTDKKKEVILTTVNDFQKEAEAEFFIDNKKVETITFKNLPPARARVLDLPVIVEAINNQLNISYVGEDKNIEKHSINLSYTDRSDFNYKAVLAVIGIIFLIAAFFFTFIYFIPSFLKTTGSSETSILNKENKSAISENESTSESVMSIESSSISSLKNSSSITSESKYTLQSLKDLIKTNTPLYFEIDQDILLPGEAIKLDIISEYLMNYKKANITLNGHTESIGLPQNEMDLSVKRSNAIKNYLKNKLPGKEINFTVKGFGATKPAIENAPSDKQYLNRRVEIDINNAE